MNENMKKNPNTDTMSANKGNYKPNTEALLYNKGNYQPTEVVYTPSLEDVKKDVRNLVGAYLPDVKDVIIENSTINGAVVCYVTIPYNSSALRDSAIIQNSKDISITIDLPSYSSDLIKVSELFSTEETKGKAIKDLSKPKGDAALKIDLLKIFATIFDTRGNAWNRETNMKAPRMELQVFPGYAGKEGKYDKITHFTIVKKLFVPRHTAAKFKPSAPFRIK